MYNRKLAVNLFLARALVAAAALVPLASEAQTVIGACSTCNGTVKGTVRDTSTFPIGNVPIDLINDRGKIIASQLSAPGTGVYAFTGVACGNYAIAEHIPPNMTQVVPNTSTGGVLHAFTRDPNSYLLGVTGGYFNGGDSNVWAAGPEAEFYAGRLSLEAWGGYAKINVNGFAATDQGFIFADAGYYPVDDLRLNIGATVLGDARFLRAGLDYQVSDGISTSLTGKIGDDQYVSVKAGLTFYFGGEGNKSLIRRHREDDPRNRLVDFDGVSNALVSHKTPAPPPSLPDCGDGDCPIGP